MNDSDRKAEEVAAETACEDLLARAELAECTVATLAAENASILKTLYRIAADNAINRGGWAESVARAELKKHRLKCPPERERKRR
jgi:hypothetical protein